MRDNIYLLLTAAACALAAWALWHYLGSDTAIVLASLAALCAAGDNVRLRRKVREMERQAR